MLELNHWDILAIEAVAAKFAALSAVDRHTHNWNTSFIHENGGISTETVDSSGKLEGNTIKWKKKISQFPGLRAQATMTEIHYKIRIQPIPPRFPTL